MVGNLKIETMYPCKILRVDLAERKVEEEEVPGEVVEKFVGGKGLAAYYLYNEVKAGTDPLSPDNKLMVFVGPLTSVYPTFARHLVASKSPLTGAFCDCYAGGSFGYELRRTGFTGIIFEGKADDMVYLEVSRDEIAVKDGRGLKGKTTYEVCEAFPEYSVMTIGPAGENLVKIAAVFNDMTGAPGVAGRGGLGAVMGSKNLKAVVVKGWRKTEELVYKLDEEAMKKVNKEFMEMVVKESAPEMGLGGNLAVFEVVAEHKILPVRNYTAGVHEGWEEYRMSSWEEDSVKKFGCPTCPVRCRVRFRAKKGVYAGSETEGLEYETVAMNGSNLGIVDRSAIIRINQEMNALGLDSISMGNIGAFTAEAFERGLIDYELRWGDAEAYLRLIRMVAYREGVGDLLAEGVMRASRKIGAEDIAIHVKGMELPAYDPRAVVGMALAYATSDRGGCHMRAWTVAAELENRFEFKGKAELVKYLQDRNAALWSLIICDNVIGYVSKPERMFELCVDMLNSMGFSLTPDEFLKTGERIWNLTRMFNVREGFGRKDDTLPPRMFEPRGDTGWTIRREDFERMLDEYYRLRGWDENGVPKEETLKKLDLTFCLPE